jgi:ribosome-associated protein
MDTFNLQGQEFIQLNQLMKILNWVSSGGEANVLIDEGLVKVNGIVETRRRNKLKVGMLVEFNNQKVKIAA